MRSGFQGLVLATLEHPAMLQYLDNNQNAAGHINENYARELMELHTLGVEWRLHPAGRAAARARADRRRHQRPAIRRSSSPNGSALPRNGAFEFNPARHDFRRRRCSAHHRRQGFGEVEEAVTLIVRSPPARGSFRASSPCTSSPTIRRRSWSSAWRRPSCAPTATSPRCCAPVHGAEFNAALGGKFKDPMRFVVSAVRFAYDGRPISNTRPVLNWLNGLGEAPFGRQTPDGYPLTELNWASSGQMSRASRSRAPSVGQRRAVRSRGRRRRDHAPAFRSSRTGCISRRSNRFSRPHAPAALNRANSQQEWNTFLLSSPDFNYE
jgi:hypothetical protein